MLRFQACLGAAALAAVLATTAAAQTVGYYTGTAADGSPITLQVTTDSVTNLPAVTSASIDYTAPCKGSSFILYTGWGYGLTADIVNRKVTSVTLGAFFNITFSLKFAPNGQSATGTVEEASPAFDNSNGASTKALSCSSPKQAISLTYSATSPSAVVAGAAPRHFVFDRKGRIIGEITH